MHAFLMRIAAVVALLAMPLAPSGSAAAMGQPPAVTAGHCSETGGPVHPGDQPGHATHCAACASLPAIGAGGSAVAMPAGHAVEFSPPRFDGIELKIATPPPKHA